jgi:hypothetical protein
MKYTLHFERTDEFKGNDDDFVVVKENVPVCRVQFAVAYFELGSGDPDTDDDHRMVAMINYVEKTLNVDIHTHCVMQIDQCTAMIVPYQD